MITGNTEGIRKRILEELEAIHTIKVPKTQFLDRETVEKIVSITEQIQREISVAVDRKGNVVEVAVGDSSSVTLPILEQKEKKLSRVRVIHTHPNGNPRLSALDVSALVKMKLDAIVAIGVKAEPEVVLGFLTLEGNRVHVESTKPLSLEEALAFDVLDRIRFNEGLLVDAEDLEEEEERAVLVGIDSEESLEELRELASAAGVAYGDTVFQQRSTKDNALFVGRGKVSEVAERLQLTRSNLVIIDDELSGSQIRNLEDELGAKVIDRTTLILEIFARRAKTREAKLQVELAQHRYRMSRLIGLGTVMSRTGGGIGTRGPGEQKLEIDRRRIRERVQDLTKELQRVTAIRSTQREHREQNEVQKIALVGYTNSGKSTLRNALAERSSRDSQEIKKVLEKDMLFATLDTTTRAIVLSDNRVVTVTDTVGFIRKLPHDLVESFKSTLEEVVYADLLVHVVDASSDDAFAQTMAVEQVLQEIGAGGKPTIIALNKVDRGISYVTENIRERYGPDSPILEISAKHGRNLDGLMETILEMLPSTMVDIQALIPYSQAKLLSIIHEKGRMISEAYEEEGTLVEASVPVREQHLFAPYLKGGAG